MKSRSQTRYRRLEAECDGLIQEVARLMFCGKCALTGMEGTVAHHVIGRRNKHLRHHPLNVVWLADPVHDIFHHRLTDQNEKLWAKFNVTPELHTPAEVTYALLKADKRLEHHLNFWNTERFKTGQMPIWECDLLDRRDMLKQLIREHS